MTQLKPLREARGVSQQSVATFLGISRQAYSNYENGTREPDFETLLKLGEYFECSIDYILRGDSLKEKPATRVGISDDDIKFALSGGDEVITDAQYDEVKKFVQFIKERDKHDEK